MNFIHVYFRLMTWVRKVSVCVCVFSPQAIRVFFMLRGLSMQLQGEPETQLPLTRPEDLIKTDDVLDLSESRTRTFINAFSLHPQLLLRPQ